MCHAHRMKELILFKYKLFQDEIPCLIFQCTCLRNWQVHFHSKIYMEIQNVYNSYIYYEDVEMWTVVLTLV